MSCVTLYVSNLVSMLVQRHPIFFISWTPLCNQTSPTSFEKHTDNRTTTDKHPCFDESWMIPPYPALFSSLTTLPSKFNCPGIGGDQAKTFLREATGSRFCFSPTANNIRDSNTLKKIPQLKSRQQHWSLLNLIPETPLPPCPWKPCCSSHARWTKLCLKEQPSTTLSRSYCSWLTVAHWKGCTISRQAERNSC